MSVARLEHWAVDGGDPYAAPEFRESSLVGTVYGHPVKADGDKIRTSRIVDAQGRRVVTASGTVYELGDPHPDYIIWMRDRGVEFDETEPVKVRKS